MPFLTLNAPAGRDALQLVATVGPASLALVAELAASGATAFRVNASHLDPAGLGDTLARIRAACPDAPVVVDLQGAKMRIDLARPREVLPGDVLRFSSAGSGDVSVPHDELFREAKSGDTLSVDDGRVRFEVVAAAPDGLEATALGGGWLMPRKGVNVENHPVRPAAITPRDAAMCAVARRHGVHTFAYSFMTDGIEAGWLRDASPGCVVIGKVERREAAAALEEVARRVDALWVCRGDLGAQLGEAALARFVASVEPRRFAVPTLMAGQVLEHLTGHPNATRSEVCHLFDLVARGYAGVVLSDETATGRDPVHAVSTAARLLASFRS